MSVSSVIKVWGAPNANGKFGRVAPDGTLPSFRFNLTDTYATVKNGFSWDVGTRTIVAPAGETEMGGRYYFAGDPDPTVQQTDEQRFAMNEIGEFYLKRRIFIPANFAIRNITFTDMSTSISGWQVGDAVTGADGTSHGIIDYISGNTVYYNYPDNGWDNAAWVGTLTNTTRSTTATSTYRSRYDNGNKHLVFFCDGYSNAGQSPTIIFGLNADTVGTVNIDFSIAVDGQVSGIQPNTHFDAVPFFTAADLGKWVDIVYYLKMSTNAATFDGIVKVWKRINNGTYTKHIEATNMNMGARATATPANCKFKQGYCFGWSNSGFKANTTFVESQFIMSATAIDGVS